MYDFIVISVHRQCKKLAKLAALYYINNNRGRTFTLS